MGVRERYDKREKEKNKNSKSSTKGTGGVRERYDAREFAASISERLDSWSATRDKLYKDYTTRFTDKDGNYITSYRGDTKDALTGYTSSKDALAKEAEELLNGLNKYGSYLDADSVKKIQAYITGSMDDLESIQKTYQTDHDYFSQFADESAYNGHLDNQKYTEKYKGKTYADLQSAKAEIQERLRRDRRASSDELNRELYWLENHDTDVQFVDSMSDDDLNNLKIAHDSNKKALEAEKATLQKEIAEIKKRAGRASPESWSGYGERVARIQEIDKELAQESPVLYYDDAGAVTVDTIRTIRDNESIINDINKDEKTKTLYENALKASEEIKKIDNRMASAETSELKNLAAEKGKQQAIINEFTALGYDLYALNHYNEWKSDRDNFAQKQAESEKFAQEHPVSATALSLISAPFTAFELADNLYDSSKYGYSNIYNDHNINQNQVYQSTVADMIDEDVYNAVLNGTGNETVANVTSWLASGAYSGVTSATQSAITTAACTLMFGPSGGTVALAIMGTEAAASSYNNAIMNGSTNGEAILTATASGIAEALFEKISLDKLLEIGKMYDVSSLSALLKSMVKNSGAAFMQGTTEASEEFFTEITNKLADEIINGDHSAYNTAVTKYKKMGYSDTDAREIATKDAILEVVEALYGGFIGGIGSGTGASVVQGTRATGAAMYNEMLDNMYYTNQGSNIVTNKGVQNLVDGVKGLGNKNVSPSLKRLANKVEGVKTEELTDSKDIVKYEKQVGKLYKGVTEAQLKKLSKSNASEAETEAFKNLVKSELESKGVKNVDKAAEIIVKRALGDGKLTREELSIFNSVNGNAVIGNVLNSSEFKADEGSALSQVKDDYTSTRDLAKFNEGNYYKRMVLSDKGYNVSTDGKTSIEATDEEVDSMLISSFGENGVTLDVKSGDTHHTVVASELRLNEDYATIIDGLDNINSQFGLDVTAANNILSMWEKYDGDSFKFIKAVESGIMYGQYNMRNEFENSPYANELSKEHRDQVFEMGRAYRQKVTDAKETQAKTKSKAKPESKVTFADDVKYSNLNKSQKAQVDMAQVIAKAFGFDLEIFRSPKVNGKSVGENGSYSVSRNLMRLDIDAGTLNGKSLILFTQAHELTHYIKAWSPAQYKVFADFLVEKYSEKDVPIKELVDKHIRDSKRLAESDKTGRHHVLTYDEAFDEVVANACEDFLADPDIQQTILEIAKVDQSIADKIKNFIKNLIGRLDKALRGLKGQSAESEYLRGLDADDILALKDLWLAGLVDARENVLQARKRTSAEIGSNIQFDSETNSVSPMFSERTWSESEYVKEREATARKIAETLDIDVKEAYKYIDDINSVARLIAEDRVRLDYEPNLDPNATVVKPNSEYKYSVDMSTLCSKRLLFTGTFDAIQRALPNTVFDSDDIVELREMMKEKGFEVACGICYVESTRREIGKITNDFIESYKEAQRTGKPITRVNSEGKVVDLKKTKEQQKTTVDKSTNKFYAEKGYTPTLADLNTTDIDLVKRDHPLVYEAYLNFMNARGQAKPKLLETRAEYKGEILKHFSRKNSVTARNIAGGLRLQSFSDFEVPHLIDMMQVIMDMSRVGLMSQAYTKVPAFAYAFGNTGVKINLSLIAKGDGIDADGNLIFDDVEGINHEEAFKIRDRFSKNVGTILVGKNDAHIIAAMADDRIDFIIPFHKSSWKESLYDALGLTGYDDYTATQNEKPIDKNREISNFAPSEYWDYSKSGDENAQIYLQKCREDGRIPKFPQFQHYEGYWKLLIDFKMYDNEGVGAPQMPVKPTFEMEDINRILNEYKGGHRKLPVAKEIVDEFVEKKKSKKDDTQFQDRDSTGRELSPGQAEFFKDSKVRDADGRLIPVFHGTNTDFTVFDKSKLSGNTRAITANLGFFFTNNIKQAKQFTKEPQTKITMNPYANARIVTSYLNIANPKVFESGEADSFEMLRDEIVDYAITYTRNWAIKVTDGKSLREMPPGVINEIVRGYVRRLESNGYDGIFVVDTQMDKTKAEETNTMFIAFNSNQIKEVDNLNPTENEDIRFQDRPYQPSLEDLGIDFKEENESLKGDVQRLRELLKLQRTVTHGTVFTPSSVNSAASSLMKNFGLHKGKAELVTKLNAFYSYIAGAENLSWDEVMERAREIAEWVDSKVVVKPQREDYADTILKDIRSVKISLDDNQMEEVAYSHGSYNAFRKSLFGSVILSNDGIKLDSQWSEWASAYPSIFDADINSADMPGKLVEIISDLKTAYVVTEEYSKEDQLRSMAMDIYDSYWKVSTLYTLADKQQKQVVELKAKHRAEMDNLKTKADDRLKYTKEYYQDMVKRVRADKDSKMDAYKERVQTQRKKNLEGRTKTATKNKIKRVVKELDKLLNKGNKKSNVKHGMQDMVNKALIMADALFDDSALSAYKILSGDITTRVSQEEKKLIAEWKECSDEIKKRNAELVEIDDNLGDKADPRVRKSKMDSIRHYSTKRWSIEQRLSGVLERQREELEETAVQSAVDSLVKAYKSLEKSSDGYVKAAYTPEVYDKLVSIEEDISGTKIRDMTLIQMNEVYNAYKMVLASVRTANEIFVNNKRMSVVEMGEAVMREVQNVASPTGNKIAALQDLRKFSWEELKPVYAFERIGSKTLMDLYKEIRRAQDVFASDIAETQRFYQKKSQAYNYDSWDFDDRKDFKLADGRIFSLNLQEIMSVYAYSKRHQADKHISNGGFVFDSKEFFTDNRKKGIKGKIKRLRTDIKAYRLNIGELQQIISSLTAEQKQFVDDMQDYLSSVMGVKGNEVSRVLYGIDLFKEKNYFPLKSSSDFLPPPDKPAGEAKLKNAGMTKETIPQASNPIVLKGFMDVWSEHVNNMSTYHSFVLPIENMNKIYNYTGYARSDDSVSVKTVLNDAYSPAVDDYITNFIQDLNGGVKVQRSNSWATKAVSLFKKTAVAGSLSVVVQQPTAIVRALALIDGKYFVHGTDGLKHSEAWDELKKYAPIAVIKEMGGFDVGGGKQVADYITAKSYKGKDKLKGFFTDSQYRDESFMWGASKADEIGWITIWSAVKKEVADTTTYKVGSEEFLKACGERFTEVIDYTQVYDSVLSRSGLMRNKGEISKMATAFMGEPTTSFNMLYNAVLQAKRGNISKGKAIKIVGATFASILLAAVAKSFVYALRDDDEGESYAEKYAQALTDSLKSDLFILNMLPYVSDVTSLLSGWDVERSDMAILKDLWDAFDGLDSTSKSPYRKVEDLAGAIAAFGGIPLKNVMRFVRGMYNAYVNIVDDNVATLEDVGDAVVETIVGETTTADVNEALDKGNTTKAKEVIGELVDDKVKSGKTEKEAKATIKASVTSYWKSRYLQAYRNNDSAEMLRIRRLLQATGLYDDVLTTCSNWIKGMKDENETETTPELW